MSLAARLRGTFRDEPKAAALPPGDVPQSYATVASRLVGRTLLALCQCGASQVLASGCVALRMAGSPEKDELAHRAGWRGGRCPDCARKEISKRC